MTRPTGSAARWYHEPYAWLVFAIPAIAVVSGLSMLWLSRLNYDGVVVDDYYKRGLAIDRDLARDDRATELRLSAQLRMFETRNLYVEVETGDWAPTERLLLSMVHTTRPGFDQQLSLVRHGDRRYAGPGMVLAPGDWLVEVGTQQWRLRGRMTVPGDDSVTLRALEAVSAPALTRASP